MLGSTTRRSLDNKIVNNQVGKRLLGEEEEMVEGFERVDVLFLLG